MTILVTGATGRVGRHVVDQLVKRGADVRVLTRDPAKADFPKGVDVAQGDLLDIDSLRAAFEGVSTLFLLNAVTGDEFTQAIITLNIAREAGVDRVVYVSVMDADRAVNVPHFAVKYGAERMLDALGFGATILRPAYFIDNELMIKDVVLEHGVYPMPIGGKGVAMIDVRDIAEVAAIELIRRDQAAGNLPSETINLVGPDTLTGNAVAAIWSDVLGRPIAYGGDDPSAFEKNVASFVPKWMAYEMRLMAERYVSDGMVPVEGDVGRLTELLGRPLHSYREFATGVARAARSEQGLGASRPTPSAPLAALVYQAAFARRVELEDLSPDPGLPAIQDRHCVVSLQMCRQRGLIRPSFRDQQPSGNWIVNGGGEGEVAAPLPRRRSQFLQLRGEHGEVRGTYMHVAGHDKHGSSSWITPDRRPRRSGEEWC